MSYTASAPQYRYDMPCGATFFSRTASESVYGAHWFPCSRCGDTHAFEDEDLAEVTHNPRGPKRLYSDSEVAKHQDSATVKDRIARRLRYARRGEVSVSRVAAELAVSTRLVRTVAEEMGVFRGALAD